MKLYKVLYIVPHSDAITESFIRREIDGLNKYAKRIRLFPINLERIKPKYFKLLFNWQYYKETFLEIITNPISQWHRIPVFSAKAFSIVGEYDLVHINFAFVGVHTARIVSKLIGCPFIISAHAWEVFTQKKKLIVSRTKGASICVCNTKAYDALKNINIESKLIYHCFDVVKDNRDKKFLMPVKLIAVGRLIEKKGFEYFIKSLQILNKKNIEYSAVIVGSGYLESQLQELSIKLNAKVDFYGALNNSNTLDLIKQSNILVCPSVKAADGDMDGIPNVILEAFAFKTLVVASDDGSICDVVKDTFTGILTAPKDSKALAMGIISLIKDENLRLNCMKNAQEIVKQDFDTQKQIEKLESFFISCV